MLKIKTHFHLSWRQVLALIGLGVLITMGWLGHTPAQSVVEGYNAATTLPAGSIVSLNPSDPSQVQPATVDTLDHLRGVVVDPAEAAVTLASPTSKVYVASTGRYKVRVSNQNGAINVNDNIGVSDVAGIGMKAKSDQAVFVGQAVSNFDGSNNVTGTETISSAGGSRSVNVGQVLVDVGITANPQANKSILPGFLQRISYSIAGKNVSSPRVYLAVGILLAASLISGSLLFAGVRSGLVAIGRNPLSKHSIIASLVQVSITSLIIFSGGLFGVYLLLKL